MSKVRYDLNWKGHVLIGLGFVAFLAFIVFLANTCQP